MQSKLLCLDGKPISNQLQNHIQGVGWAGRGSQVLSHESNCARRSGPGSDPWSRETTLRSFGSVDRARRPISAHPVCHGRASGLSLGEG